MSRECEQENIPDPACESCPSRDKCSEIYGQMGQSKAPPMGIKAFLGFLVPIGLFILGSWAILSRLEGRENLPVEVLAFTGGLAAVAIYLAGVWAVRKSGKQVKDGSKRSESADTQAGNA